MAGKCEYSWIADIGNQNWRDFNVSLGDYIISMKLK